MALLHHSEINKPVETIHPSNLPKDSQDPKVAADALDTLVDNSAKHPDVEHGIHAQMHKIRESHFVQKLIPGMEKVASDYHVGNFVVLRGTGEKFFESMPLYPRCVVDGVLLDDRISFSMSEAISLCSSLATNQRRGSYRDLGDYSASFLNLKR